MPVLNKGDLQRRLLRPLLWSVLAMVVIYGGSVIASDFNAVSASIRALGMAGWAVVLGLSLANYALRFLRWEVYLSRLNSRIPAVQSLAYYIGGFAFTTTPGKAGEAVRSLYLKRHGVPYTHSLAALFAERLVDLVAMVLLSLVAALAFPAYRWPVLIVTMVILMLLPIVHANSFHAFLGRQVGRLSSARLRSVGLRLLDLIRSASFLLRSAPLYAGLILALIAWGAEGLAFYVILEALDVHISLELAVGIYSVSVLVGALSFIPGGLGSTEVVMVLLLKLVGLDTPVAVAATLICRLATLWFAVILGAIALAVLEIQGKAVRQQAPNV